MVLINESRSPTVPRTVASDLWCAAAVRTGQADWGKFNGVFFTGGLRRGICYLYLDTCLKNIASVFMHLAAKKSATGARGISLPS